MVNVVSRSRPSTAKGTVEKAATTLQQGPAALKLVAQQTQAGGRRVFTLLPESSAGVLLKQRGPESWVPVLGPARGGKSFLLNKLCRKEELFKTSGQGRPCTAGVDISPSTIPFHVFQGTGASNLCPLRFLDVEGSGDEEEEYYLRLYAVLLLLSPVAILNLPSSAGKSAFLEHVAKLALAGRIIEREGQGGPLFGHLQIVCRNFSLHEQRPGEYQEYLLEDEAGNSEAAKSRNDKRALLRSTFRSITLHLFPAPIEPWPPQAGAFALSEKDGPFQSAVEKLRQSVATCLAEPGSTSTLLKGCTGPPLSGRALVELLKVLLEKVNAAGRLAPTGFLEGVCTQALKTASEMLKEACAVIEDSLPMKTTELTAKVAKAFDLADVSFATSVRDLPETVVKGFRKALSKSKEAQSSELLRANSKKQESLATQLVEDAVRRFRAVVKQTFPSDRPGVTSSKDFERKWLQVVGGFEEQLRAQLVGKKVLSDGDVTSRLAGFARTCKGCKAETWSSIDGHLKRAAEEARVKETQRKQAEEQARLRQRQLEAKEREEAEARRRTEQQEQIRQQQEQLRLHEQQMEREREETMRRLFMMRSIGSPFGPSSMFGGSSFDMYGGSDDFCGPPSGGRFYRGGRFIPGGGRAPRGGGWY